MKPIILENKKFRLALSAEGAAESLILKSSGKELLANADTPFIALTEERPYCFKSCKRGYNETIPKAHEIGTIGGILDISEFCAVSAYIDQKTSLQGEIAEGIAGLYDAGFEFLYLDGSEGGKPAL